MTASRQDMQHTHSSHLRDHPPRNSQDRLKISPVLEIIIIDECPGDRTLAQAVEEVEWATTAPSASCSGSSTATPPADGLRFIIRLTIRDVPTNVLPETKRGLCCDEVLDDSREPESRLS